MSETLSPNPPAADTNLRCPQCKSANVHDAGPQKAGTNWHFCDNCGEHFTTYGKTVADLTSDLLSLVNSYTTDANNALGVSAQGLQIHKLVDEITSAVYGQEFSYCGRTHQVI